MSMKINILNKDDNCENFIDVSFMDEYSTKLSIENVGTPKRVDNYK